MSKKRKADDAKELSPPPAPRVYVLLRKTHIRDGEHEDMDLLGIYSSFQTLSDALLEVRKEHNEFYQEHNEEHDDEDEDDLFDVDAMEEPWGEGGCRFGYYVLSERLNRVPRKANEKDLQAIFFDPETNRREFAFAGTMTALEKWAKAKMMTGLERWMTGNSSTSKAS